MKSILPAVGLMLSLGGTAWAQESGGSSAPTKDKEAVDIQEIVRGVNVAVGGGPYILLAAPKSSGVLAGQLARVEAGYDFGERVTASIFLLGTSNRASSSYCGASGASCPFAGDFSALIPGANVRVNIVGFNDSQEIRRIWIYAKGGAGYAIFQPSALLPYSDIFISAAGGIDYFTHLRHFSIGLELSFSFLLSSASPGLSLVPNLRYAF